MQKIYGGGGILKANELRGLSPKGVIYMKKTLSIVLLVLLVFLAVACSPEHQHDYKLVESKSVPASCESNGYNYMECSCGAIESIPTVALGHAYVVDEEKSSASTCIKKGNTYEVCTRCNKINNIELPLDSTNHPYRYNKAEAGNVASYVGVFDDENVKYTTWPTCANDGVGVFTSCTACNKTGEFTVAVPSKDFLDYKKDSYATGHVKMNAKGDGLVAIATTDIKDENWKVTTPATAFVDGKKTAICPTCGELFTKGAGFVDEDVDSDIDYALGEWTTTAVNSEEKIVESYILDLSKKLGNYYAEAYYMKKTNGVMDGTAGALNSELTISGEGLKDLTNKELTNYSNSVLSDKAYGFTSGEKYYAVAELVDATGVTGYSAGDFVIISSTSDWSTAASWGLIGKAELTEHEHEFKLMTGLGAVMNGYHYLECSCGLAYVEEDHGDAECDVCGHDSTWKTVTMSQDTAVDVFCVPVNYELYLPGKTDAAGSTYTWNCFNGKAVKYNQVTKDDGSSVIDGKTSFYKISSNATFSLGRVD